jgi:hypothetical protein
MLPFLRRVRWIGAVLDGGAHDLMLAQPVATPVEKAMAGLARAVAAQVEKATDELEKVAVGQRRGGEGGR